MAYFSPGLEKIVDEEVGRINHVDNHVGIFFVDGSSNFLGIRLRVFLKSPQEEKIVQAIYCEFKATNKEARYKALIEGMTLASDLGVKSLKIYSDSLLIVSQLKGEFSAKDSKMALFSEVAQCKSKIFLTLLT